MGDNSKPDDARRKRKGSRPRSAASYVASAKRLAKLAPSLKKYTTKKALADARKGKLSPQAKAAITRKEKALRHAENLHPLTKRQYKQAKKLGIAEPGGIQAVKLRNTEAGAIVRVTPKGLAVGTNGRTVRYERVSPPDIENLIDAAARLFDEEYRLDEDEDDGEERTIEVVRYGKETTRIRRKKSAVTVWLWTIHGRASRGFRSLQLFIEDISKAFAAYKNQDEWILGIAWLREKLSR